MWNDRAREATLGVGSLVQLGASVSSLYLAQVSPRMAVIEWRPQLCEWLTRVVQKSSGRLGHLEIVCIGAEASTKSGIVDAAQVLRAFDECCTGFDARSARVVELSGLVRYQPTRQQVLHHVASVVSKAPTYVGVGGWSDVEPDLKGIALDRVVGVGAGSPRRPGGPDRYGYMVLTKPPYSNKHHAEFAKHQAAVQVEPAGRVRCAT